MKAVRADRSIECPRADEALRERGVDLVLCPDGMSEADFLSEVLDADLILTCYQPVTEDIIRSATRLTGIVKYGVGIDAIDVPAAQRHGVPVVNVPDYAEETVAECAFALLLALAKRLTPIEREMAASGWVWPGPRWIGADIAGKTVGIIGVGRIGASMARMARAGFRARVLGFDPHVSTEEMRRVGVQPRTDLREMLAECDFVSVHAVLTPQSRHLIGAAELACMKPSAFLVNVSRGEIVDEGALVDALQNMQLAGAALDAYGQEPLTRAGHPLSPLFAMDNVILFPHLAFYTTEAMHRLENEMIARCTEILAGGPVLVRSSDPRLTSQTHGVVFDD